MPEEIKPTTPAPAGETETTQDKGPAAAAETWIPPQERPGYCD